MGWTPLGYPCHLHGCSSVSCLPAENRKEPNGPSELVWTRRVHDVICGSGTAVSHCVILFSCSSLVSHIFCVVGQARGHMSVYILHCKFYFFYMQVVIQDVCILEPSAALRVLRPICCTDMHMYSIPWFPQSQNRGQNCRICQEKWNLLLNIEYYRTDRCWTKIVFSGEKGTFLPR